MTGNTTPQLALLSPARDATQAGPGEQVRVLTWNVQHAAAARTHQQALWLATAVAHDVLVLTEVAAGETGRLLARLLGEFGYTVHLPEAGDDKYRVLLACRGPILEVVSETGVGFLPHRCVAARVTLPGIDVGVIGLYVPSRGPKDQRNVAKRAFQEAVTAALPSMSARLNVTGPVVITGDLNVVEPDHDPRYPVFGPWEYDFYRAFSNAGFVDAFRITHPTGMDYSWFGRPAGNGRRNGYRFDHTFITTAHATTVRDCRYLHESRENGLSDHSPMTLTASSTAASPPAACVRPPLVFLRYLSAEMARVGKTDAADIRTVSNVALSVIAGHSTGSTLAVHTWASGAPKIGYSSGDLFILLATELATRGISVTRAGREHTLSCCITAWGVSLGFNRAEDSLTDWPGGRVRLARDEAQVSRAEFKLEELLQLFPLDLPAKGRAVDLGASPGGWTRILRQRGMTVWAVDPGDLDPRVTADPGVHHAPTTAGEFFRSTDRIFDLVVNDMRMDPLMTCEVMIDAAHHLRPGGLAIVTLKTGHRQPVDLARRCLASLSRAYEIKHARQLHHNRHEVTVVARRKPGVSSGREVRRWSARAGRA